MVRKASIFKLRDLARALKATKLAGVHAQIDILRDGTLRVTPMPVEAPAAPDPETNEWDRILGKPAIRP